MRIDRRLRIAFSNFLSKDSLAKLLCISNGLRGITLRHLHAQVRWIRPAQTAHPQLRHAVRAGLVLHVAVYVAACSEHGQIQQSLDAIFVRTQFLECEVFLPTVETFVVPKQIRNFGILDQPRTVLGTAWKVLVFVARICCWIGKSLLAAKGLAQTGFD